MSAAQKSAHSARLADALPRRIGKYRIITQLGEGGQARVFLAYLRGPAGFHKLVVIKVLRDDLEDEMQTQSLRHEARLAGLLNHPNVVQTHEVGESAEGLFIAMEYVDGQSLGAINKKLHPKRLPLTIQLRILVDVARALHHAHTLTTYDGMELKIVHRDISPHNVMIAYDGQVKLVDFGIAKAQGSDEMTHQGVIKGKVAYMSPEQLSGTGIDHRADIFALGVIMWQAITGQRFAGGSDVSELTKIHNRLTAKEPRLREAAPHAPLRLIEICDKALSLDPVDRHATAEEFADELSEYLADSSLTSQRELADILRPLFLAERERLRALIDEHLRRADSISGESDVLEIDGHTRESGIAQLSRARDRGAELDVTVEPELTGARSAGPSRLAGMLGIVVGLAVVSVAVAYGLRTLDPPREDARPSAEAAPVVAAAAPPASAETSATAEPAAAPQTVRVRVTASPSEATATLDGSEITLPLDLTVERSATLRTLVVSAPGYDTTRRALTFERDVELTIELSRARSRVSGRGWRPASSSASAPSSSSDHESVEEPVALPPVAPAAPPPARRSPLIDTEDPYQ